MQYSQVPDQDFIPAEQKAYNILRKFFDETPVAEFFGGTPGATPVNFLQIYNADFAYAASHHSPVQVTQSDGSIVSVTAQDLLNLASQKLQEIAEPATFTGVLAFIADCLKLGYSTTANSLSQKIQEAERTTGQDRINLLNAFKSELIADSTGSPFFPPHVKPLALLVLMQDVDSLLR